MFKSKKKSAWKGLQSKAVTKNPFFHKIRQLLSVAQYEEVIKLESSNQTLFPNQQKTEAVKTDRNSEEHPQNEVNQKELPKLNKHFTKSKECQGKSHLIYCQARPSSKLSMLTLCVIQSNQKTFYFK